MRVLAKYESISHVSFMCKGHELVAGIATDYLLEGGSIFDTEVLGIDTSVLDDYGWAVLRLSNGASIEGDIRSFDGISGNKMWIALAKASVVEGVDTEAFELVLAAVEEYRKATEEYHDLMRASGMSVASFASGKVGKYYHFPGIPGELLSFDF